MSDGESLPYPQEYPRAQIHTSQKTHEGFRTISQGIPDTIVTNHPETISDFVNRYPKLYPWTTGDKVTELQELLGAHGFSLKLDGDFGWKTEAAVRAFQREYRLRVDGMVGPETWAMLMSEVQPGTRHLRQGHHGRDVKELQGLLQVHDYRVQRHGFFGDETEDAVRAFQRRHTLREDGVVCPVTWTLLRAGRPTQRTVKPHKGWLISLRRWW